MVDRANSIKQMIPALPDEKIGNYDRQLVIMKKNRSCDSARPSQRRDLFS